MVAPMNNTPIATALAPPMVIKATLLLAEFCPVKPPGLSGILDSQLLAQRASMITSVLKEIIAPRGWTHGGIND